MQQVVHMYSVMDTSCTIHPCQSNYQVPLIELFSCQLWFTFWENRICEINMCKSDVINSRELDVSRDIVQTTL